MSAPTKYRMIGTTDDVIDCEKCGKVDLRMTVVLEMFDADGNSEGITYYGSTCAARALAARGVRVTAATVRQQATYAQQQRVREAADARRTLDFYSIPTAGAVDADVWETAVHKFRDCNREGGVNLRSVEWARTAFADMVDRRRGQLAGL